MKSCKNPVIISLIILQAAALKMMGREAYCKCGYVKLWHGVANDAENSQHLTDWYTFSHIIHGFIFFYVLQKIFPKMPFDMKLIAAVIVEIAWELLENSEYVINRYRSATISLDYYGDSIVNSMVDVAAMVAGFWFAAKMPWWFTLFLAIIFEFLALYFIKDNLTLNILMLLFPMRAIQNWQSN